jgi:AAA+ ATPase superfamily predicted ATPase
VKPDDVVDRDEEWTLLERHVTEGRARLGIVTGRRRVGKTYLLRRLADRYGGLFVACLEEEREPALRRFAEALGRHHGLSLGPPRDWAAAFEQATTGPLAVPLLVVDEVPYLLAHSPELESVVQHAIDQSRDRDGTRIVLSGSSLAIMSGLLEGGRPLRGRADLQLVLSPFDYRLSRAYWNVTNPAVAFRLHAMLGGSPGYRVMAAPPPNTIKAFDRWVVDAVINPAAALYHEDAYLLGEDRRVTDRAIYASVMRAIAAGDHRPSRIAARVGRAQTSLSHVFRTLAEAGFVDNVDGVLSGRDPRYELVDPVIGFLYSCVEPWRALAEEGRRDQAWTAAAPAWHANVLGPHLERLARVWASRFASSSSVGGPPGIVGRAEIPDPSGRITREIDVAVLAPDQRSGKEAQIQAIGESKLTADLDALGHLDRCVQLLEARGHGRPRQLFVVCETATPVLRAAIKRRHDVDLIDLDRLYHGD